MDVDDSAIVAAIRDAQPACIGIYLFGSRAQTGLLRPDSDLDVAVLGPTLVDVDTIERARENLQRVFPGEVDLIDLRSVDTVFQHQILAHGRVLWRDPTSDAIAYEVFAIKEYADESVRRQPIINDIIARGRVFHA